MEVGKGEIIYLSLHCHHQNDSCIKMGSDESHFNVSLIVRDKVTRPCPQTATLLKRKESRSGIEPRSFRLPAYRLTARPNRLSLVLLLCLSCHLLLTVHFPDICSRKSPIFFVKIHRLFCMVPTAEQPGDSW